MENDIIKRNYEYRVNSEKFNFNKQHMPKKCKFYRTNQQGNSTFN